MYLHRIFDTEGQAHGSVSPPLAARLVLVAEEMERQLARLSTLYGDQETRQLLEWLRRHFLNHDERTALTIERSVFRMLLATGFKTLDNHMTTLSLEANARIRRIVAQQLGSNFDASTLWPNSLSATEYLYGEQASDLEDDSSTNETLAIVNPTDYWENIVDNESMYRALMEIKGCISSADMLALMGFVRDSAIIDGFSERMASKISYH